ncbi:DUF7832 domain-containing protein [Duganella violaceipulchra]|uniref:DUF7832 domain-containing protein n=1 Tax=Duganella violaceipulchra TaxID=2849652 RepID=UPI003F7518BC
MRRRKWALRRDIPQDQPEEHGGTHIALFLKWCFIKGWAGKLHLDEEPEAVAAVISGTMPATEFAFGLQFQRTPNSAAEQSR